MAVRKTGNHKNKNSPKKQPEAKITASAIIWIFIIVVLIAVIFFVLPLAKENYDEFSANRQGRQLTETETETAQPPVQETPTEKPPAEIHPETETRQEETVPAGTENTAALPAEQLPAEERTDPPPVATVERAVYFMQLDSDGNILQPVRTVRRLGVSQSPLRDSLEALIAGATAEERTRGLESFIPQRSRILSINIRENTAFINFNRDFQYNPLGREGTAAQLRQIVWTATEFPNVQNVQFLIEGERVDYLTEGINIANPIGR